MAAIYVHQIGNSSSGGGGSGTVTSVGLAVPTEFTVTGSPVTGAGTLTITKVNEIANTVWAGPASGGAGQPTFRALVPADLPSIANLTPIEENITLSGTDITNQYVDLAHTIAGASDSVNSLQLSPVGGINQLKTIDFIVDLTGGSAGVTRVSFSGDIGTGGTAALVAGDILIFAYSY